MVDELNEEKGKVRKYQDKYYKLSTQIETYDKTTSESKASVRPGDTDIEKINELNRKQGKAVQNYKLQIVRLAVVPCVIDVRCVDVAE
jgi:uncharacterized protein YlxW (UPF0749 family)